MDDRSHTDINEYASGLIHFKARQLSRCSGFSRSDGADVEQELWTDLLARWHLYDPTRATLNTFIARVVEHKVVSLLRYHLAEKRSSTRVETSLNESVPDGASSLSGRHAVLADAAFDTGRERDLEQDVAAILSRLPDDLRAVALELAFGTPNSAGSNLGISRRSMTKVMHQIREIFHDAGLDQYL